MLTSMSGTLFGSCVKCHFICLSAFVMDTESGRQCCKYTVAGAKNSSKPRENSFSAGVEQSFITYYKKKEYVHKNENSSQIVKTELTF